MSAVTVVGMVAGGLLIAVAAFVFVHRKEFPAGGIAVSLVGVVLIGMSQWSNIRISGAGVDIDLTAIQRQIDETAQAVDAVAEATVSTAAAVETTQGQLIEVTEQLESRQLLTSASLRDIQGTLRAAPTADTGRVNAARDSLRAVVPRTLLRPDAIRAP